MQHQISQPILGQFRRRIAHYIALNKLIRIVYYMVFCIELQYQIQNYDHKNTHLLAIAYLLLLTKKQV